MHVILQLIARVPVSAKIGVFIVFMNVAVAVFAPILAPYGETEIVGTVWEPPAWSPSAEIHSPIVLLGTDQVGRDLFSRMLFGARNTIGIAFVITFLAFLIGVPLALFSSLEKGWIDQLISRVVDIVLALPTLMFSLVVISILGSSVSVLIVVIGLLNAAGIFRVCRAVAMDVDAMDFIEVAKLRGEPRWWVLWGEMFPNVLPPLLAEFGIRFCFVFLFISSLSFLGLGIQPPTADWGSMVRENAIAISYGIVTPLVPAFAIAMLTVGINLLVDWFHQKASGMRDLV